MTATEAANGVRPTTFIESDSLSSAIGASVTLASEAHQVTGSFKFRAALHVARSVANPHIIAASSGNFGQALARACQLTKKQCTIVIPANSVRVKVEAVRSYGARVELVETTRVSRADRVAELAREFPDAYIASAYDDDLVIQGNASLGRELAAREFDVVVVPVGGGGLAAGVITGLANSQTKVWGAEPAMANDAARSLREGRIVVNEREPQTIADGARTVSLGKRNWDVIRDGIAGIMEVSEDAIVDAVRILFSAANVKAEPTGALALAGLMQARARGNVFAAKRACCVVSGGNVDPGLYAEILSSSEDITRPKRS